MKFDVPTLVLHGEHDRIVPVRQSAIKSTGIINAAKNIYYGDAPRGITTTHQHRADAELLAFLRR